MKRGLVVLDHAEVPDEEWSDRVSRLQRRIAAEGLSVALIYGDVFRSDDIGYLTNLCIYWNEGVLALPSDGSPAFLTKLSPRVHPWMRATSKVTDLRSGKNFGQLVQTLLQERQPGALGLIDGLLWPAPVVEEIEAAVPHWEVRLLGGTVREQRVVPSSSEVTLLRTSARLLRRAFDEAERVGASTRERIAIIEREMRGSGFTDLMANATTTSDSVTTLEVTGQYRQGWVHRGDVTDDERPARPWVLTLNAALQAAVGAVIEGAKAHDLASAAQPHLAVLPSGTSWHIRCVNQADMATKGEYEEAGSVDGLPGGTVVVIGIDVLFNDGGRAAVAETVLVGPDGPEVLTAPQQEAISATRVKESSG